MKLYLFDLKAEDAGTYTCNATVNGKLLEKIINLKIFSKYLFALGVGGNFPISVY